MSRPHLYKTAPEAQEDELIARSNALRHQQPAEDAEHVPHANPQLATKRRAGIARAEMRSNGSVAKSNVTAIAEQLVEVTGSAQHSMSAAGSRQSPQHIWTASVPHEDEITPQLSPQETERKLLVFQGESPGAAQCAPSQVTRACRTVSQRCSLSSTAVRELERIQATEQNEAEQPKPHSLTGHISELAGAADAAPVRSSSTGNA